MKKSLIYITAGIAAVGFGVPAFAAHGDAPRHSVPTQVTVATVAPTIATTNSVEDNPARIGADDNGTSNSVASSVTSNSVEDNPARVGVDDDGVDDSVTSNSVEDNPARVGVDDDGVDDSVTTNTVEDNGVDAGVTSITVDDSGHHGGGDA